MRFRFLHMPLDTDPRLLSDFEALCRGALPVPTGNCPSCHEGDLQWRSGSGRDPDTGYFDEDYYRCSNCGECYDVDDLVRLMQ